MQHRPTLLTAQFEQELLKTFIGWHIKTRLRLIQYQQLPGSHHTERQHHTLQLTAGQLTQQTTTKVDAPCSIESELNSLLTLATTTPGPTGPWRIKTESNEFRHG
jgi:hypothetical protein